MSPLSTLEMAWSRSCIMSNSGGSSGSLAWNMLNLFCESKGSFLGIVILSHSTILSMVRPTVQVLSTKTALSSSTGKVGDRIYTCNRELAGILSSPWATLRSLINDTTREAFFILGRPAGVVADEALPEPNELVVDPLAVVLAATLAFASAIAARA